jgi:hypothetical protein
MNTCDQCKYFEVVQQKVGVCRRYPRTINKSAKEWCGEFMPGQVIAEVVPVYDITTDQFIPKKRGRKPKNVASIA